MRREWRRKTEGKEGGREGGRANQTDLEMIFLLEAAKDFVAAVVDVEGKALLLGGREGGREEGREGVRRPWSEGPSDKTRRGAEETGERGREGETD